MKLNGRLAMIAGKIPKCNVLADIGTDHAYIPIYAVESGLCGRALAADLRTGPLEIACANIRRRGLEEKIETRLGNGLEPLLPEECDVVVIAGMGGTLIRDILSSSAEKAKRAGLLLLQPNNGADVLRKWLYESGFGINAETLAMDAGKLYCLISAGWTGISAARDELDCYIGKELLEGGDPLLHRYIEKKIKELDIVIAGRAKSRKEKNSPGKEKGQRIVDREPNGNGVSFLAGMTTEKCMEIRNRLKVFQEMKGGAI